MTDLQASLIGIGTLIVICVVSYNKWQEHKAKKSVDQAFATTPDDALMGAEESLQGNKKARSEPVFASPEDLSPSATVEPPAEVQEPIAPEFFPDTATSEDDVVDSPAMAEEAPTVQASAPVELPVDDVIDCLIPLSLEQPVSGEALLPLLGSIQPTGNKQVQLIGQHEDGHWETVVTGPLYVALVASVQMANRSGVLDEVEYSDFVRRLQQAADQLQAHPDTPDMVDVVAAARNLQEFVSEFDAQLSINLRPNSTPWPVGTLKKALERQGFNSQTGGKLTMPDGEGGTLFSLLTNVPTREESTHLLTLLLDVPRIAPERDGFGNMVSCARTLAARLDASIVDDSGQVLSDPALDDIAGQVKAFYQEMAAAEIPAGSRRALRLFN